MATTKRKGEEEIEGEPQTKEQDPGYLEELEIGHVYRKYCGLTAALDRYKIGDEQTLIGRLVTFLGSKGVAIERRWRPLPDQRDPGESESEFRGRLENARVNNYKLKSLVCRRLRNHYTLHPEDLGIDLMSELSPEIRILIMASVFENEDDIRSIATTMQLVSKENKRDVEIIYNPLLHERILSATQERALQDSFMCSTIYMLLSGFLAGAEILYPLPSGGYYSAIQLRRFMCHLWGKEYRLVIEVIMTQALRAKYAPLLIGATIPEEEIEKCRDAWDEGRVVIKTGPYQTETKELSIIQAMREHIAHRKDDTRHQYAATYAHSIDVTHERPQENVEWKSLIPRSYFGKTQKMLSDLTNDKGQIVDVDKQLSFPTSRFFSPGNAMKLLVQIAKQEKQEDMLVIYEPWLHSLIAYKPTHLVDAGPDVLAIETDPRRDGDLTRLDVSFDIALRDAGVVRFAIPISPNIYFPPYVDNMLLRTSIQEPGRWVRNTEGELNYLPGVTFGYDNARLRPSKKNWIKKFATHLPPLSFKKNFVQICVNGSMNKDEHRSKLAKDYFNNAIRMCISGIVGARHENTEELIKWFAENTSLFQENLDVKDPYNEFTAYDHANVKRVAALEQQLQANEKEQQILYEEQVARRLASVLAQETEVEE